MQPKISSSEVQSVHHEAGGDVKLWGSALISLRVRLGGATEAPPILDGQRLELFLYIYREREKEQDRERVRMSKRERER